MGIISRTEYFTECILSSAINRNKLNTISFGKSYRKSNMSRLVMNPYQTIYAVIRRVPQGRVATYGQIAHLARVPSPRMVGYALRVSDDQSLPWHRIVNAKGEISARWRLDSMNLQKKLLIKEGIHFKGDRIDLAKNIWK